MIDPFHKKLSVSRQCELLNLPRSSYYRKDRQVGESEYNLELMRLLDEEYTRRPFYGSRKLRKHLNDLGYKVNRKRVQRLMKLMGISSVAPGPNTSKGRCMDNIFIERLWRSVKYEEVYLNEYESVDQLRRALGKYFYFYNEERPHQHFDYQTPMAVYQESVKTSKARVLVDDSGSARPVQAQACA